MPATTRSKSKQSHLEDFESNASKGSKHTQNPRSRPRTNKITKKSSSSSASESKEKKRKSSTHTTTTTTITSSPRSKKSRQGHIDKSSGPVNSSKPSPDAIEDEDNSNDDTITINRSPVLQLWSACVAHRLYPKLSWTTDLAIGSAISTLCAIAKGKSVGTIDERERSPEEKAEQNAKRRAAEAGADREVQVMGFRLYVEGEDVMLQGKPKHGNEGLLRSKFGTPENYERTTKVMQDAIETWTMTTGRGYENELNSKAFRMYEQFRPSVQSGQSGWGKKGALKLTKVREVVAR
ncbi:hypothetical protein H2204_015468 [Knufia peltigerae]|uniref:Uncharacterized protein n=1 Tax=Knufia peltigerae TaxID=1002370 RepID=A0AA38XBL5_9EURO|nr:hypothetical protein H2204_015468 [Knufia peltigerae]